MSVCESVSAGERSIRDGRRLLFIHIYVYCTTRLQKLQRTQEGDGEGERAKERQQQTETSHKSISRQGNTLHSKKICSIECFIRDPLNEFIQI